MATNHAEAENAKVAIAHEVIVSAGNILVAAGFQRDEIAGFFRQAAEQLVARTGPDRATRPPSPTAAPTRDIAPVRSIIDMQADFAEIAPVRALAEIAAGPQVVAALDTGAEPTRSCLELALGMFPHIAEAQNWLRDTAREAGCEVVADRRHWLATALPEALAQADQIVFLDDFAATIGPCFEFVTALVAAMVRENDRAGLDVLLHGLVGCGIIVTHDLKVALETAVTTLIPRNQS